MPDFRLFPARNNPAQRTSIFCAMSGVIKASENSSAETPCRIYLEAFPVSGCRQRKPGNFSCSQSGIIHPQPDSMARLRRFICSSRTISAAAPLALFLFSDCLPKVGAVGVCSRIWRLAVETGEWISGFVVWRSRHAPSVFIGVHPW